MDFDIHQFDDVPPEAEDTEFTGFRQTLVDLFAESPEGQELQETNLDVGRWADALMYFGYQYEGESLPEMDAGTVRNVVYDLFPRKISLGSPEEADVVIPELKAFWKYVKREFHLRQADAILQFLEVAEPEFPEIMNDPANFGMAKSLFALGRDAGFDMTSEDELSAFMMAYNAALIDRKLRKSVLPEPKYYLDPSDKEFKSNAARKAQKRKRKQAEQAKKRNRKRRK